MSRAPIYCDQCGLRLIEGRCARCCPVSVEVPAASTLDTAHKIKTFDELHSMCVDHINKVVGRNHVECDCDRHIFEVVMMACAGKDIFSKLNKYGG